MKPIHVSNGWVLLLMTGFEPDEFRDEIIPQDSVLNSPNPD